MEQFHVFLLFLAKLLVPLELGLQLTIFFCS